MGEHNRSRLRRPAVARYRQGSRRRSKYPPLPNNVGRTTTWKWNDGNANRCTIEDELRRQQSDAPHKAIVLQKIRHEADGRIEFRLGYYMIGVKPRMKGKWTWGQYATLIPARDFRALIKKARQRDWI